NDVRPLFESLVADPPPDPLDLDAVVARGTHRRRVRRVVTAGAGLAAALVVGSGVAVLALPDDTRTAPPATPQATEPPGLPDQVEAVCTPEGMTLSASTVAARASGVALVVSSTMAPGTYLSYSSDGGGSFGGGDRLPAEPATWTLPLAPGTITLACDPPGVADPDEELTLTVTDPEGYWRGESLGQAGCENGNSMISWVAGLAGSGRTPDEAVADTLDGFRAPNQMFDYTARPAGTGYVDAATQTWVMLRNNKPYATILVTATGDGFEAMPDALCGSGGG
ncbi:MAG: hypothetical protein Q8O61_12760, partial [Nocardioides sp.]|nr:hypothetical protein [Nocardioides sp.]